MKWIPASSKRARRPRAHRQQCPGTPDVAPPAAPQASLYGVSRGAGTAHPCASQRGIGRASDGRRFPPLIAAVPPGRSDPSDITCFSRTQNRHVLSTKCRSKNTAHQCNPSIFVSGRTGICWVTFIINHVPIPNSVTFDLKRRIAAVQMQHSSEQSIFLLFCSSAPFAAPAVRFKAGGRCTSIWRVFRISVSRDFLRSFMNSARVLEVAQVPAEDNKYKG